MTNQEEIIARLYHKYKKPLFGYLTGFFGNRNLAEEVLQQVFAGICRKAQSGMEEDLSPAYLFRAAKNEALRIKRKAGIGHPGKSEAIFLQNPPEAKAVEREERERLQKAISRLPDEQKEVVLLRAYDALKFEEIANALDIPLKTAISRYQLALGKLKAMLGGDFKNG